MFAHLSTIGLPLLVLALLLGGAAWWWRQHRQSLAQARRAARSALNAAHKAAVEPAPLGQPQAALVLGSVERKAYRLLREAYPRAEVLAHVQLLRFIRMPPRDQREEALQGAGVLDVDLLLCDGRFRVLAAIDVRTRRDTPAGKERSERMAQVLQATGISVHVWHEGALPSVADIRATVTPAVAARKAQARALEASGAVALPAADSAPDSAPDSTSDSAPDSAPNTDPALALQLPPADAEAILVSEQHTAADGQALTLTQLQTPPPRVGLSPLERAVTLGRAASS